ncbi:RNA-binding protein [Serratia phage vB_SspM_BZS1]|nr:RNA-binding protein [Serratia phage vB_SspM_BZS1]
MKERPVIFNGEMVRAILDGRKTQTRRVMKDQPEVIPPEDECGVPGYWIPCHAAKTMVRNEMMTIACPSGQVGDRLWVRETFAAFDADWKHPGKPHDLKDGPWPNVVYPASVAKIPDGTCRPSIHMPRWASRITLEITAVRVERLNDISEEDAKSEGVKPAGDLLPDYPDTFLTPKGDFATAKVAFQRLWQSIYGEESWSANPWVWVIEFRRVGGA